MIVFIRWLGNWLSKKLVLSFLIIEKILIKEVIFVVVSGLVLLFFRIGIKCIMILIVVKVKKLFVIKSLYSVGEWIFLAMVRLVMVFLLIGVVLVIFWFLVFWK